MYATKSNLHLFLFGLALYGSTAAAYEIPRATLELTSDGFTVAIPDDVDNGVKKVFYVLEVNNECSPLIKIMNEPTDKMWKYSSNAMKLKSSDQVSLAIMVQHEDDVYIATECLQVDNADLQKRFTFEKCESRDLISAAEQASVLAPNCERAQMTEVYNKLPPCVNELIFSDEFDSNEVNTTKWTVDNPLPSDDRSIDYEFTMYDKENVNIRDGKLVITPTVLRDYRVHQHTSVGIRNATSCAVSFTNACPGRPIISGRITTKHDGGFKFRYGRIEIRAKFPIGDWLYPSLLLDPVIGFRDFQYGQMRVGFASGNRNLNSNNRRIDASTLYGGLILDRYNIHQYANSKDYGKPLGDDFHTYTLIWERDHLTMQLDGEEYGRIDSPIAIQNNMKFIRPFNEQSSLTIGLAAGGFSMFPQNTNPAKPWGYRNPKAINSFQDERGRWFGTWTSPNLEVEYVRIYAI